MLKKHVIRLSVSTRLYISFIYSFQYFFIHLLIVTFYSFVLVFKLPVDFVYECVFSNILVFQSACGSLTET